MVVKSNKKSDDSKLFAFLGVFLTVIGFIIAYATKKDDKYVMFYAKQGLVLFIGYIVLWVVGMVLAIIPFVGGLIYTLLSIGLLILWIFGLVYSLSGEMKDIPIVGDLAKKLDF
jgi:uncharacterized membrane protein